MEYVITFLTTGVICLLGQILFANTKLGAVRFFMIMISLGAIFSALGIMNVLNGWAGGGIGVMTLAAGDGMFGGAMGLLTGDPSTFLLLWLMLVCVFATANICAALVKMGGKKNDSAPKEDGVESK